MECDLLIPAPEIKDLRTAAHHIALGRIAEAYKAIGI